VDRLELQVNQEPLVRVGLLAPLGSRDHQVQQDPGEIQDHQDLMETLVCQDHKGIRVQQDLQEVMVSLEAQVLLGQ